MGEAQRASASPGGGRWGSPVFAALDRLADAARTGTDPAGMVVEVQAILAAWQADPAVTTHRFVIRAELLAGEVYAARQELQDTGQHGTDRPVWEALTAAWQELRHGPP